MQDLKAFTVDGDAWQMLARETRPLVIYGMGNGADKLIDRLSRIGKAPAAIFASDDFVRGQTFRGFRVCRFSDIREQFSEFVILVSFGSRIPDVMNVLFDMAEHYPLFLPDMPVAGDQDFTASFFAEHIDKIQRVYSLLEDDLSRSIYLSTIRYKLTGDIRFLKNACSTEEEDYACLPSAQIRIAIDGGAYNGDTAKQMMQHFPNLKKIYAVEPDEKNHKKLCKFAADQKNVTITPHFAALWSETGVGTFATSGNRNSSLVSSSYEHKMVTVPLLTVDSFGCEERIDYIKYDVEGAERQALQGSRRVIKEQKPALAVSLYHRSEDLFDLPLLIYEICPDYRFFLRRASCLPAWEITLYAIRKETNDG